MKYNYLLLLLLSFLINQDIYTNYLVENGDTIDVFSYQIPLEYDDSNSHPLLVAFHQWGGNENSNYYTQFDEEANNRNWIMLSPYGGSSNNYNHQGAQAMVEGEILWMIDHYNIDSKRIYMVGGSMGGAAGAIYANNHLDPTRPMIAATVSASGILDCERRAIEMDGNNSMIEWFGGNWDEVPFEYHRNSAVYFADSTQSMHYNLQHTPLYLDFGETEPHRIHAEDLYNLLLHYNESMWIDTDPTGSHGYSVIDANHACDWLSQYNQDYLDEPQMPYSVNVNLDEPSRAYWLESTNQFIEDQFIRINANWENSDGGTAEYIMIDQISNSDSLILHVLDEDIEDFFLELNTPLNLGFSGVMVENESLLNSLSLTGIPLGCSIDYILIDNVMWLTSSMVIEEGEIPCYEEFSLLEGEYSLIFEFNSPEFYEDINQDGIWDIIDIILVINHIMGTNYLTQLQQSLADLNQDGIINILDIMQIMNIILEN